MIKINIVWAMALYLFFTILVVFILWLFYNRKKLSTPFWKNTDMIQCPYCSFIFYNLTDKEIQSCPKCKSYININEDIPNHNA